MGWEALHFLKMNPIFTAVHESHFNLFGKDYN